LSRIFLIDNLIKDQVGKFGASFIVDTKIKTGDRRGSSSIKKRTIKALSQPMSEKRTSSVFSEERTRMPEGDKFKEWRFYSMTQGNKVDTGDTIHDNGKLFEVKSIQDWGTSMNAVAVKVD